MTTRIIKTRRIGALAGIAAFAALLTMAAIGPARADDRDWRAHEVRTRHWHAHPEIAPVVYAPPVIYSPPPPPEPGINLIVPLNFH